MKSIRLIARLRVHEGKLDEVRDIGKRMLECVREKDDGAVIYECFLNEERTEFVTCEAYEDADAIIGHQISLGSLWDELRGAADLSLDFLGTSSPEPEEATRDLDARFYGFFQVK